MEQDEITFGWRDEYLRKPIAEKIIKLLVSDVSVSPLIVNGGWGTGKTEFCHKTINLLKDTDDYHAVYVDAFKADHADQPLMLLLAAILKLLPADERTPLIKKALPAVRFGLKTALKAGVSWVLKQDAADVVEGFEQDIKAAGNKMINGTVESLLIDHVDAEKSIKTLQIALGELASEKPIVLFVDELDRCRPDFAVSLLESIKHVFDVDGVQFVLVTNSDQLRASINHCYGSEVDAQRYLDKFVVFGFTIPHLYKPDGHVPVSVSASHIEDRINNSEILHDSCLVDEGCKEFVELLVTENQISLREVETFVKYLEIYQLITDGAALDRSNVFGYTLLRCLGVFLLCIKPNLAKNITDGFVSAHEVSSVIGVHNLKSIPLKSYPEHADVIAATIAYDAESVDVGFASIDEGAVTMWEEHIHRLLTGRGGCPRKGNRVKIIVDAIDVLKLGG